MFRLIHRLPASSLLQWKLLACLQLVLSVWLVEATQHHPSLTLLAVVIWGGAAICMEDRLDSLNIAPSRASLLAGFVLLAYATWRSAVVADQDSSVYLLPFLQGLGLALLARPVRHIAIFKPALIVLSLFPLQLLIARLIPDLLLSVVTGKASQWILLIFGVNAALQGRVLSLGEGGGVRIQESCNGVDMIAQVTIVAIVFVLAFPIRSLLSRFVYVALAPGVAFAANACRISILAVISSSSLPMKKQLFDFLHLEWGGFVFAGLAIVVIGQMYMILINRELGGQHG